MASVVEYVDGQSGVGLLCIFSCDAVSYSAA